MSIKHQFPHFNKALIVIKQEQILIYIRQNEINLYFFTIS